METNETDKMLRNFFGENKQEIADNGFSKAVMQKIPVTDRSWIVWLFAAIGMTISIYLGLSSGFLQHILVVVEKIPYYYLLGGVALFPLVGLVGYYLIQEKKLAII